MLKTPQSFDPRQQMNNLTFEAFYYKEPKATEVEVHHHDFYEVYNLLAGDVSYWVDGKTYHLRPGDLFLISPMELHRPIVQPGAQYERFVLWINKNYLESLSDGQSLTQCFHGTSNQLRGGTVTPLLSNLVTEQYSEKFGADIYAKGIFLQLMVELNRLSPIGAQSAEHSDLIAYVLNYINTHYSDELSLDSLADQFHISKYHLSHEFKKETGTSIYHYITLKRLAAARQMLIDGKAPGDVYLACGFRDYTVFYKAFKAEYGTSPAAIG